MNQHTPQSFYMTLEFGLCKKSARFIFLLVCFFFGTNSKAQMLPVTVYRDLDGDRYGNASVTNTGYIFEEVIIIDGNFYDATTWPTSGWTYDSNDCDDSDASVWDANKIWYRDLDGDGMGNSSSTTRSCRRPSGYVFE